MLIEDSYFFEKYNSFIHFGLTSQDINNTAISIIMKNAVEYSYIDNLKIILKKQKLAKINL